MSTATRLAAYYATEASILQAQEVKGGDRSFRNAELAEVRAAIKDLETQFNRETATADGNRGNFAHANLNGNT